MISSLSKEDASDLKNLVDRRVELEKELHVAQWKLDAAIRDLSNFMHRLQHPPKKNDDLPTSAL